MIFTRPLIFIIPYEKYFHNAVFHAKKVRSALDRYLISSNALRSGIFVSFPLKAETMPQIIKIPITTDNIDPIWDVLSICWSATTGIAKMLRFNP